MIEVGFASKVLGQGRVGPDEVPAVLGNGIIAQKPERLVTDR